jgi:hypothetical protein
MIRGPLFIGTNTDTKGLVYLTDEQRSTHVQIIGSTGTGKSKLMEHLIREDIAAGNGLCLIDPHGYLYHDTLKYLQGGKKKPHKVILFDPSEDTYATGFNPLRLSAKDLSYQVDAMVRACAKVWGGEDTDRTPLLKRCLRITFHALAEGKLTLLEAQYLTSPTRRGMREYLTAKIKDPVIKEQWDYFNSEKLPMNRFYEEFGSTINRTMEFLAAERIRNIIGQQAGTLDFKKIMDEGYFVLVNLSSGKSVSHDNARLIGTLIVNDLFLTATERPPESNPFYLYIDECSLFINEDIGRILDEGRKFGLHLVLAHQHLAQLKKAGEDIYHSVMTDAKTKIIFGGLSAEDARVLSEQVFLGELDLEKRKATLDKPTVVGYTTTWLNNYSKGKTHTKSEGSTTGRVKSEMEAEAEGRGKVSGASSGYAVTSDGASLLDLTTVSSWGEMSATSESASSMRGFSESEIDMETRGESWGTSETEGRSEALKPILKTLPTSTYSLEEQIHKAMATMVNQPTRHAIVKLPGLLTKRIRVPEVKVLSTSSDETVPSYKADCFKLSPFTKTLPEARKEIEDRRQYLLEGVAKYQEEKTKAEEKEPVYRQKPTPKK